MLDLLARLAELHTTEPQTTPLWSETGIFTDAQFSLIMTKCLRSAGLPVGASKSANATLMAQSSSVRTGADASASHKTLRMKKPSDRLYSFAMILVYSMAKDGNESTWVGGSKALTQLAKFVQATETYFHPSNWGLWQVQLANFVQHLTWEFARRCQYEAKEECRTPADRRLTSSIRVEFVRTLRTVCLLSMFSKDPLTSLATQSSLKRMAFLEPSLILPAVLQRSFTSLEALETTQRTTAVIATLAATSQPLVSMQVYPAGAKHLAPLLHLCLPGIDLNDPMKTMSTCMLILSISVSICIVDGTSGAGAETPDETPTVVDEDTVSTLGAEDYAARLATAELDAWSTEFVRRVLMLFTALPEEGKSGKIGEKNEEMVLNMLIATCDVFCSALGEDAFARCWDIVWEYVRTTTAANGVKVIGSLVGCFARADAAQVLKYVVPYCCERIESELAHGASSVRTTSTSIPRAQDTALHWHINVLSSAVMFAGAALLPYKDVLVRTLARLVEACYTERGYMLTAKLVQRVLTTLLNVYVAEQRFVNPAEWASHTRQAHPHRLFGRLYRCDEVDMAWHTPSSAEVDMALDVLTHVVEPALSLLDARLEQVEATRAWHNDVCRTLLCVRYALAGQGALAEEARRKDGHVRVQQDGGDVPASQVVRPVPVDTGHALASSDPRYARVMAFRERVGATLARAAHVIPHLSADHVDAMKQLVRLLRTYLVPHSVLTEELQGLLKSVSFFRTIGRRWAKQQRFPRILWLRRAMLYHATRQRWHYAYAGRTDRDDALLRELVGLCMSHYVAVRRLAQTTLESVCSTYEGTRLSCIPALVDAMSPTASDEQVKGALYVVAAKSFQRTTARHPSCLRPIVMALAGLQARTRPSIQKLVRGVWHDLIGKLEDPTWHVAYATTGSLTQAVQRAQMAALSIESNRPAWLTLVDETHATLHKELLALLASPRTHWAFALLSLRTIRALLRRDRPCDTRLVTLLAQLAISDNLDLRHHAQQTLVRCLYLIKLRTFSEGMALYLEQASPPYKHRGPVGDPEARMQAYATPRTMATPLHDKSVEGWLVWPPTTPYYVSMETMPTWEAASQASLDALSAMVGTASWWEVWARHASQEMERDYLAADVTVFVKSLVQVLGPPLWTCIEPCLQALVAQRDRHPHRAAAELVGGVLRGSKHWPLAAQDAVTASLQTWLPRTMVECTLDSQPAWQMCMEYVCSQRDPRRYFALLTSLWTQAREALAATSLSPGQQAHTQQLLASAVHALQGKAMAWGTDSLADVYLTHFAHDYQEVRKAVGDGLVELELAHARPAFASVDALLQHSQAQAGSLLAHDPAMQARCAKLRSQLSAWRAERMPSVHGTSTYDRAASTMALWICLSLDDHRLGPMSTYVLDLMPALFDAFQLRDHEELSATASDVLIQIASHTFGEAHVAQLLETLLHVLETSTSWHSRADALPLLQIVYFQNLFFWTDASRQRVLNVLVALLRDPHVEVRDMAATTLSGVVRCSQRAHIVPLSRTFAAMAMTPLPKRGTPGFDEALSHVHAGVLGATALVAAFPYDVPDWMPSLVLDTIAPHTDSPVPVSTTVRRCAAEFRRTHQDTWAEDQVHFGDRVQEVHDFTLGRSDYFV